MATRGKSSQTWNACKRAIQHWPSPGLINLVRELYNLSDDNRRFLHARLLPEQVAQSLESAERKVRQMLSPQAVLANRFRHIDIKRLIDQYAKAIDDFSSLAQLLLADVDAACETFAGVGDDESLVDHIYATMTRLQKCLESLTPQMAAPLVARLSEIAKKWDGRFGYGVSDELMGMVSDWQERIKRGK